MAVKTYNGMNPAYVATMVELTTPLKTVRPLPTGPKVKKPSQAGNPRCMQCGKERYARVDSHFCTHKCALAWADDNMVQVPSELTVKQASLMLEANGTCAQWGWCQRCMVWAKHESHSHALRVWPRA